jgi:hypothetical protein
MMSLGEDAQQQIIVREVEATLLQKIKLLSYPPVQA